MKLTNQQFYDYVIEKLDKSGSPYFEELVVNQFANEAYLEWIRKTAYDAELTEARRGDLAELTKRKVLGTTKKFTLDFTPVPKYILALNGDYDFECNGIVTTRTRPITPINFDQYSKAQDNPDLSSNDAFPDYIRYAENSVSTIEIISNSTPKNVEMFYIKEPVLFDIVGNPDGFVEIGMEQQYQVLDMVVAKLEANVHDFNSNQVANQEIQLNE